MKRSYWIILAAAFLCSCQSTPTIITERVKSPTPSTTSSAESAIMISPSDTPVPTLLAPSNAAVRTPDPSLTPTTTYNPFPELSRYFPGAAIVRNDDFRSVSSYWYHKNVTIQETLTIKGTGSSWESGISRRKNFIANQGIALRFSHTQGSRYEIFIENGEWYTANLKRFGIYCGMSSTQFQENTWQGTQNLSNYAPISGIHCSSDTWFTLVLGIQPDSSFKAVIWAEDNPQQPVVYEKDMDSEWENLSWVFRISAERGNVLIDDFVEFQFTPD